MTGPDAVQTHMTNSRLTDPEILESGCRCGSTLRHPARVGRQGRASSGDGVVRRVTFLEPMRANILANRRDVAPRGLNGGGDALPGRNWVERTDGSSKC